MPNEIPVVFYNGSNYDYHFVIKELANEFEDNSNVLEKRQKSKKLFPFQQKKKLQKLIKMVMKVLLIDSARLMASSLLNFVDNLTEGIHKIKCKDCDCFLEHESIMDILIKYKCLYCNNDYSNKLDKKLKK